MGPELELELELEMEMELELQLEMELEHLQEMELKHSYLFRPHYWWQPRSNCHLLCFYIDSILLLLGSTHLLQCLLITSPRFCDYRGFFGETYSFLRYVDMVSNVEFVQDNHSLSRWVGALRGLHYQAPPAAQDKLVRCGRGAIFDVAVDIRRGSPTYGQCEGYELSSVNGYQLYVPFGFALGFVTLEPDSEIVKKCTDYHAPVTEGAVRWDGCGIEWPLSGAPVLSDKNVVVPALADFDSPFIYGEN